MFRAITSPYLQRMSGSRPSSSHVIPSSKRPLSATSGTSDSGQKPRIDPKFIADPDLWDPATPREPSQRLRSGRVQSAKGRPISAPTYKRFVHFPFNLLLLCIFSRKSLPVFPIFTPDLGRRRLTRTDPDQAVPSMASVSFVAETSSRVSKLFMS